MPKTQYELAKAYLSGTGVPKDSKQGVDWLRKAANLEHPAAELALAIMYMEGEQYISEGSKTGLEWLRKSPPAGLWSGGVQLGSLYRRGDEATGMPEKTHEAANWFRKAARQQGANSQTGLQEMLQQGLISRQEANWQASEPVIKTPPPRSKQKRSRQKRSRQKRTSQSRFSRWLKWKRAYRAESPATLSVLVDKF